MPMWARKKYWRLEAAAQSAGVPLDTVDRLFILDRGIINPKRRAGNWEAASADSVFLESYLHVVNFLMMESERASPSIVDVRTESASGWKSLA
jgi:hypothetical protein